ncbi:MAG: response regulator [Coriobacteriia bacterium]|nr:response regulator [Coriobacteriia bacterium]
MGGLLDGVTFLIAEDNPPSLRLVMTLVTLAGGTPTGVVNGNEAVEAAAAGQFDIVLMDVKMPLVDGLEATRAIRDREKDTGDHLFIVGVTAHAMAEHVSDCHEAGMDAVITKPLDPVGFAQAIRDLLDAGCPAQQ